MTGLRPILGIVASLRLNLEVASDNGLQRMSEIRLPSCLSQPRCLAADGEELLVDCRRSKPA